MRAWLLLALFVAPAAAAGPALGYVADLPAAQGLVIVDARAKAACARRSVRGARCLPASDFLGPNGRLVGFSQAFWLLGTAGLTGREHVAVVGEDAPARDFVAGMLYLCGQRRVSIVAAPFSRLAAPRAPGAVRALTRQAIYQATAREDRVVLRDELARARAGAHIPLLLAGSDARLRSVPAPTSLPARLRPPVVYARDPYASVAYFTALRAHDGDVRVLLDGPRAAPMMQSTAAGAPYPASHGSLVFMVNLVTLVLLASVVGRVAWRSR